MRKNLLGWLLFAGFIAGCAVLMRTAIYESERLAERHRDQEAHEQAHREIDEMLRRTAPALECDDGVVKFAFSPW